MRGRTTFRGSRRGAASLAADPEFSSTFGASRWLVPPVLANGTPTFTAPGSGAGRLPGWLMDASTNEAVAASCELPEGWETVDVDLWWANAAAGSGNVSWRLDRNALTVGGGTTSGTNGPLVTVAAGASGIVTVTRLLTGITAEEHMSFRLNRLSSGDTLGNDASAFALRVVRAS